MSSEPNQTLLGTTAAKPSSFKLIDIPDECQDGDTCQETMDKICKLVESYGGAF